MNRFVILVAVAVFGGMFETRVCAEANAVFRGEITDSQCGFNIHSLTKSHEEMLKSKSGAAGHNSETCAIYCITRLGGKFVLANRSHVYHLDNQDTPGRFVGKKVKLTGTLDGKTDTIHVTNIEEEH